jgi:hypothetical protein
MTAATSQRQSFATRFLAVALLLLVTYGSSFQTIHHHRSASANSPETVVAVTNPNSSDATGGGALPDGKCLVCQFQRQLATSVAPAPLLLTAPVVHGTITESIASSYTSQCETPRQGRGPPLNS